MPYIHAKNRAVNKRDMISTLLELIFQWERHNKQVRRHVLESHCGGNVENELACQVACALNQVKDAKACTRGNDNRDVEENMDL